MLSPLTELPPSSRHVLVAEDSLIHQRLATTLLVSRGLQVTMVDNGYKAVLAAREGHFDLILMDIEMPVLDGCAAVQQIRVDESTRGAHVPIVAVTSLDDENRILNAGVDSIIAKPLTAKLLDNILHDLASETADC